MADTTDPRPWKVMHHSSLGPLNKGHPDLKGCLRYFDFAKQGTRPTKDGHFYPQEIGPSPFVRDGTGGSTITKHGGQMQGGERSYNIFYTGGVFMDGNLEYVAIQENKPGFWDQIKYNQWTFMEWHYIKDQGATNANCPRIEHGDYTNSTLPWSVASGEHAFRTYDDSNVDSGWWTSTNLLTGNQWAGRAIRHMGATQQFRAYSLNADGVMNTETSSTRNTQSGYLRNTANTLMRILTDNGNPVLPPIVMQVRFYNRNLTDTEIYRILRNPWAPRSGRRGGHRN
jgi:hypothetical protein